MLTTVDEILASGRYTDRRGQEWDRRMFLRPEIRWANIIRDLDGIGWPGEKISEAQMRLLIERDLHRDECPGLALCRMHPVPFVILWPMPTAIPARTTIGRTCMNHERAFNEARLMAVAA